MIITLVIAIGLVLLVTPAAAQQAVRVQRVGLLFSTSPAAASHVVAASPAMTPCRSGAGLPARTSCSSRGGRKASPSGFPEQAAELVRQGVDVIVASSQPAAVAARSATTTLPIVMVNAADPIGAGLVASLAQPGGNVTGLATQLTPEIRAKQLQLIKEAFPELPRVTVLRRASTAKAPEWAVYPPAARALGLRLQFHDVQDADDLAPAFAAIARGASGRASSSRVATPCCSPSASRSSRWPTSTACPPFYATREFTEAGGLMSYSARLSDQFRRAATYVDRILRGARPATLPVETPTQFELAFNLRTAKALGLTIPQAMPSAPTS